MDVENLNNLSREEIVSILNSMQDTYYRTNTEGKVVLLSPSVRRLLGYAPEDIIGTKLDDYYYDKQGRHNFLQEMKAHNGALTNYCAALRHKDGSAVWVSTSAHYYYDDQGRYLGVEGISRDISLQKAAEEENRLLQRQLQQAQKMEAIGQLSGGIAHDFNNILTSILGYASLGQALCASESPQKLKKYFNEIYRSGERAGELVKQMLTYSRGEPGEYVPLNLPAVLHDTLSMLRVALPEGVQFTCRVHDELNKTVGVPTQLQQVLMNLCINASDAISASGGLEISLKNVSYSRQECSSCHCLFGGEYVLISVADTGKGIADDIMDKIFNPFFSTKEVGKGTGMGLSMVHGIVHQHQGHIVVNSVPSMGSVFDVLLPIAAEEKTAFGPASQSRGSAPL